MIEKEDIEYMEAEVRNGNATKALANTEERSFFEGCAKEKENFEFVMGHRKFLMSIVNFLKTYAAEHGRDCFPCEHSVKRLKCKRKAPSTTTAGSNKKAKIPVSQSADHVTKTQLLGCLNTERSNLLTKALTCLINYSPHMYVEACVKVN